jgi:hypothetical protein
MRETIQVSDDVQVYDLLLLIGEAAKVAAGTPATLTIISPWITNIAYYLGSSGISIGIPAISFGKSDVVRLLDAIKFLRKDHRSQVRLATLKPSFDKYSNDATQQIWELRFLLEASEKGAKNYFYTSKGDIQKIMHPKFLLTSLGVVFGSFNLTRAGRYSNIEDGNYASSDSPVYFEKKHRVEEIISECEEVDTQALQARYREFEARIRR